MRTESGNLIFKKGKKDKPNILSESSNDEGGEIVNIQSPSQIHPALNIQKAQM